MKKVLFTFLLTVVGSISAMADAFTDYVRPDWNDYEITFASPTNTTWNLRDSNTGFEAYIAKGDVATLTATVAVDAASTFSFELERGTACRLYLNNTLVRTFDTKQLQNSRRYMVELASGTHTIKWELEHDNYWPSVKKIGVEQTPLFTTELDVAGSLGAELAYFVKDKLDETRRLKVVGPMNAQDWETIGVLKNGLYTLDLSEAIVTEVPEGLFRRSYFNSVEWQFLHNVKLPEGLKKIGYEAFLHSNADINIPSTIEEVGDGAFYGSGIKKGMLPDGCLKFGQYSHTDYDYHYAWQSRVFQYCYFLEEARLPAALTYVPPYMFYDCQKLNGFELSQNVVRVGRCAFEGCENAAFVLPSSLVYINQSAFRNSNLNGVKDDIVVPENVVEIVADAFYGSGYKHIELPKKYYKSESILPDGLISLRLNSPTVVETTRIMSENYRANVTLQVPDFLVSSYMSDTYWSNFKKVEGFSSDEISDWEINRTLTLTKHDRVKGNPSFVINEEGCFSINGSPAQTINNLRVNINPQDNKYGVFDCNTDAVTINGELSTGFYAQEKNKWYYLVLPYDMKASEVVPIDHTAKHAIRYYDGANRAEVGATGSWKNFEADAIIPAGTGFIFQASAEQTWWKFPAQNNASKQNVIERNEVSTALAAYPSESQANKGWNLVGNPYTCYYYIRRMNFPAPITIRNGNNYEAYSPIDDEYVLAPYQAFFVQCPDDVNRIDFLIEGCQTTSAVPTGYNAPALASQDAERCLTDIVVSDGVNSDRTRVVLNEQAAIGYETMRDAGKWMGEGNVPQLYTYDEEGNKYAINERPVGNGIVNLGFSTKQNGHFTISLPRNSARKVILVDNEEGLTIDLTSQDYAFMANAGTHDKRFTLYMNGYTTGIDGVSVNDAVKVVEGGLFVGSTNGAVEVFSLDGIKKTAVSASGFVALPAGCYIIKCNGQTAKVVVK